MISRSPQYRRYKPAVYLKDEYMVRNQLLVLIIKTIEIMRVLKKIKMSLRKGQRVKIEKWVVADQSDGKISTTVGTIFSNIRVNKVLGCDNEYNGYIKVKLDCGNILNFNWHELN